MCDPVKFFKGLFFFPILIFLPMLNGDAPCSFFPPIDPYRTGHLEVEGGHSIYWEESGNPKGPPVLFLHGGPGLGTKPDDRRFFDPTYYRIVLFDQRGCGKSLPYSCLSNNTTWDLVRDIEILRQFLDVDQWFIFGGSWGSTLGLTYAIKHSSRVKGLVLRGVFLCRQKEIQWFYQYGAHCIFPDLWEDFVKPIPLGERNDLVRAFYQRLTGSNTKERREAVKAWAMWEGKTSKLRLIPSSLNSFTERMADALSRIECHYFFNHAFFDTDRWILDNIDSIRHLPCIIIHGRYDIPCPLESAWELHLAWPEADLKIIPDAGHSSAEPGIMDALIQAMEQFKNL